MPVPLKIGITCYPSVGGSGILALELGEELAARGHEVHFISYERPFRMRPDTPRMFFHPVQVSGYDLFKYPDYTLPLSVKMAEVARAHALDVLHVHYAVPHATAAILARAMLPADARPRIVTTLHGTDTTLLGRDPGYGPAIRYALENSDVVTTVSEFLRGETQRLFALTRPIEVVHNFFAPRAPTRTRAAVRAELGVRDDEALVLHLSNLRPVKRIDLLLETAARLPATAKWKLVVLAGGDFTPYLPVVQRLGLAARVVVRSNVLAIEDYLQAADAGLFTSEMESFCLSVLELMAFGVPSVATAVGGIPEVMRDGLEGALVPTHDAAALAAALGPLLADAPRRAALGAAGRARAREIFSAASIVPRYEEIYRRGLRGTA
ncbi:MAG: N-acetyl-alpha-D-glucosaminyl L-malate synthase BshA [Verrucomicrobiota bacterium]|jgi:N-acetyl-alpha-D-glucosaminyl L-malate synthase BshA